MAAGGGGGGGNDPSATLHEEATCAICLDYFQEPVMIAECGHNFCRACITQHEEKGSGPDGCPPQCPQCRRTFRRDRLLPNRPLKNMVATIRQLSQLSLSSSSSSSSSREPPKGGCPAPPKVTASPAKVDLSNQGACGNICRTGLVLASHSLPALPPPLPPPTPPNAAPLTLFWGPQFATPGTALYGLRRPQDPGHQRGAAFAPANSRPKGYKSKSKWKDENVLLDPDTAHPRYLVSGDWKSVCWANVRQNFFFSNPKRFEFARCILGTKGYASGKHRWTVDVGDGDWAVGVALESVSRDEELDFEPDEGIWAIACYGDEYKALTWPRTSLDLDEEPTEIRVCLNYGAGSVTFYDAEDNTRLYSFKSVDFEGEKVFPFFRITDSSSTLQLC